MSQLYAHDPFLWLQGLLWSDGPFSDWLWLGASWACTGWGMTVLALLFVRWRTGRGDHLIRRTMPAFAALLTAGVVAQTLKAIIWAPRPQARELASLLEPGTFHVLEVIRGHSSFPSGHSASAAALATWGLLRFGGKAWPLLVLALLGGLSRVAVGAHWTFDVLGGWTTGALGALAAHAVGRWLSRRRAAAASPGAAP